MVKFSTHCSSREPRSSGLLRNGQWYFLTDVSEQHMGQGSKSILDPSTSRRKPEIVQCLNCDELYAYCMQTSCVGNFGPGGGGGGGLSIRHCKLHHPPCAFSSKRVLVTIVCKVHISDN
jgi:hypothetical protein